MRPKAAVLSELLMDLVGSEFEKLAPLQQRAKEILDGSGIPDSGYTMTDFGLIVKNIKLETQIIQSLWASGVKAYSDGQHRIIFRTVTQSFA